MNKFFSLLGLVAVFAVSSQVQAGATEIESAAQYNQAIQGPATVVMVYSSICPHCIKMLPVFRSVADSNSGVKFVLVEANKSALAGPLSTLNVRGVPAFKLFKKGQLVASSGGEQSASQLAAFAKK